MNTDDADIALRCLALAAELKQLDNLDGKRRQEVLAEAAGLLGLVAEVFLEPEHDPSRN